MKILFHFPDWGNVAQNRQYQKNNSLIYPVLLAMQATYLKQQGHIIYWDEPLHLKYDHIIVESKFATHHLAEKIQQDYPKTEILGECVGTGTSKLCPSAFTDLPAPDRVLTKWKRYSQNGNYKYLPGTHMQSARDCWYGRCQFCSWAQLYPKETYSRRTPESMIDEVIQCYNMGIREIFDDSGTFPVGKWLAQFCDLMKQSGMNKHVKISCNMRFGVLTPHDFDMMKEAGFRMILWGLEQYDQFTLTMLNKGVAVSQICDDLVKAKRAGLENHVAVMYGYPWIMPMHEQTTYLFVRAMMLQGVVDSVQATIFTPYPNTPMYKFLKSRREVKTDDWSKYDMQQSIIKGWHDPRVLIKKTYRIALHPRFMLHQLSNIRSVDDIKFYMRALKKIRARL